MAADPSKCSRFTPFPATLEHAVDSTTCSDVAGDEFDLQDLLGSAANVVNNAANVVNKQQSQQTADLAGQGHLRCQQQRLLTA